jgi:hypothetical protein
MFVSTYRNNKIDITFETTQSLLNEVFEAKAIEDENNDLTIDQFISIAIMEYCLKINPCNDFKED